MAATPVKRSSDCFLLFLTGISKQHRVNRKKHFTSTSYWSVVLTDALVLPVFLGITIYFL